MDSRTIVITAISRAQYLCGKWAQYSELSQSYLKSGNAHLSFSRSEVAQAYRDGLLCFQQIGLILDFRTDKGVQAPDGSWHKPYRPDKEDDHG